MRGDCSVGGEANAAVPTQQAKTINIFLFLKRRAALTSFLFIILIYCSESEVEPSIDVWPAPIDQPFEFELRVTKSYGKPVPDFDWTVAISELLIAPLTVTSTRKLLALTVCPDCDWV